MIEQEPSQAEASQIGTRLGFIGGLALGALDDMHYFVMDAAHDQVGTLPTDVKAIAGLVVFTAVGVAVGRWGPNRARRGIHNLAENYRSIVHGESGPEDNQNP